MLHYAVGVVPTRLCRRRGVSPRYAAFRAAYERVISSFSDTAYSSAEFSYNTHCKATLFRAVGPGRGGFLMGKGARDGFGYPRFSVVLR